FIFAYPMNWWLVAYHLKHGMMTVRPAAAAAGAHAGMDAAAHADMEAAAPHASMSMGSGDPPWPSIPVMTLLSFLALVVGVAIAFLLRARAPSPLTRLAPSALTTLSPQLRGEGTDRVSPLALIPRYTGAFQANFTAARPNCKLRHPSPRRDGARRGL